MFERGLLSRIRPLERVRLARYRRLLAQVARHEQALKSESEQQLRDRSLSLRYRAQSGETLGRLLPEAYALVREAARRTIGMRHYDVQILGGIALFDGAVAEMETGEGKTLTATLPMYLRALPQRGAYLATANDYLAERDAELMEPVYSLLGLSIGVILADMSTDERRENYARDITYGTARDFGFDFLRDRLRRRGSSSGLAGRAGVNLKSSSGFAAEKPVQRELYFVLVDEADSLLIDEARTPLILSTGAREADRDVQERFRWSASIAKQFVEDRDYENDQESHKIRLTTEGRDLIRSFKAPAAMDTLGMFEIYDFVERAIQAHHNFRRDRQYVVRDDEVLIVDEYTGRVSEGRKWRDGLHQAIEAKEDVPIFAESSHLARVTVQHYLRKFEHLSGMTGTALSSRKEFRRVYKLNVIRIPTNRPVRRVQLPDQVFTDNNLKWAALVEAVRETNATKRPVLIGTRSIAVSDEVSDRLTEAGIEHEVLNARNHEAEADIVGKAGEAGRVTVATNMAGRGTDIKLGDGIAEMGGLFVVCTELHDSARIDRQLAGRSARQGDPGSVQFFLSLDDEILSAIFEPDQIAQLKKRTLRSNSPPSQLRELFYRAQRTIEKRHYRQRLELQHYEKHRFDMHAELGQDPYLDSPV